MENAEQSGPRMRVVHGMGQQPTTAAKRGRGAIWLLAGVGLGAVGYHLAVRQAQSLLESRRRMTETLNGGAGGMLEIDEL